jgi:aminopeptidase N
MIKGTQRALDYNTANFGPYPHKQVRILETPLYQTFARSFPGTIPFSESLGFISDMRDPDSVDHVFYVTAHEMAHQWWGDQIIAANVQGSAMLTESLAEYSALMALEKEFGAEKVRHILRWDMDQYLAGRGKELVEELPLTRTESQVYLHYRKGSLAFYRLREEIGEAALNRALKNFLDAHRYQSAPYVTSLDLLKYIRAQAGHDKQELITDLFERIVIYDNRVLESRASRRADGKWDVTVKLNLAKLQADGKGKETARQYDEPVDIAIFSRAAGAGEKDERVLHRQKYALHAGESTVTMTVAEKPSEVGVDPYNLLIDRVAGDNRKKVDIVGIGAK